MSDSAQALKHNTDSSDSQNYENLITESIYNYLAPFDADGRLAKLVWPTVSDALPSVLDGFYNDASKNSRLSQLLKENKADIGRLKNAQKKHWEALFQSKPDANFRERAKRVGAAHVKVGLDSQWYLASYGRVLINFIPHVLKSARGNTNKVSELLQVFIARMFMDMIAGNEAYARGIKSREADIAEAEENYQSLKQAAATVADVNKVMLNLAILNDSSSKTAEFTQSISAAVEEMVASMEQISENSEHASEDAQQSNAAVREAVNEVDSAAGSMSEIATASAQSLGSLETLEKVSSQVSDFLAVIQDIADQTNLLALNATIEAARAGDAGKGFAVVASEVKQLANQSAKATVDVSENIGALQHGITSIRSAFNATSEAINRGNATLQGASERIRHSGDQVNNVATRLSEIATILNQQRSATTEISSNVNLVSSDATRNEQRLSDIARNMRNTNTRFIDNAKEYFRENSPRSLCQMAKIDHIVFKKRVVDTVLGADNFKAHELPDHHTCRLGKWYDHVEDEALLQNEHFKQIAEPHRRVHAIAKEALTAMENRDRDRAMKYVEQLDGASDEVINLLNTVAEKLDSELRMIDRRQFERRPVDKESAYLVGDDQKRPVQVHDVSAGGFRLYGVTQKDIGRPFRLEYEGKEYSGAIVWCKGEEGGFKIF